jgi:hypothetical protein
MTVKEIAKKTGVSQNEIVELLEQNGYLIEFDGDCFDMTIVAKCLYSENKVLNDTLVDVYEMLRPLQKIIKQNEALKKHDEGSRLEKDRSGHVYIMNVIGTNFYKIGRSKNISEREKALKIGNHRIRCVASISVKDSIRAEKLLHSLYIDNNVGGEFFEFNFQEFNDLINNHGFLMVLP